MGYGLGIGLVVVGLILALAVNGNPIPFIGIHTLGWILVLVGVLALILTGVTLNSRRRHRAVATTTHADGTQTVTERRVDNDPLV